MSKIKLFGAISVLAVGLGIGGYFLAGHSGLGIAAGTDATTVAIVNGEKITRKDVDELLQTLPATQDVSLEQIFPVVVDQLVNDTLLGAVVKTSDITSDPEVDKRMELAKDQIIRGLYVERYVEEKVTEKEIKAEYDKLQDRHKGIKEVRARHILVDTEAKAKEIVKQLDGGADFAELAKEKSTGPTGPNGGDLGYFTKEAMVPEFSNVAFNMKKGSYSKDPVKTQFGWHVVYVEDRRDRPVPKFAEVEQVIRNQLNQKAVDDLVRNLRNDADIKLFTLEGKPIEGAVN